MWIRKELVEMAFERRRTLLSALCIIVLLWAGLWYILELFREFFDLPSEGLAASVICIVLFAAMTLVVWRFNRREDQQSRGTVVCDHCNKVKSNDGHLDCKCGGRFLTLAEMKWISPAKAGLSSSTSA